MQMPHSSAPINVSTILERSTCHHSVKINHFPRLHCLDLNFRRNGITFFSCENVFVCVLYELTNITGFSTMVTFDDVLSKAFVLYCVSLAKSSAEGYCS